MARDQDTFGDERLKKDSGTSVRGTREAADSARLQDGGSLSPEERRRLLRQEYVQEILPSPPPIEGFHLCWVSTTNPTDPVYKRLQRGYLPVKASEVPGFGGQFTIQGGEFDGCIACNEMLLFKVSNELWNDLMVIQHHEIPLEQEGSIHERLSQAQAYDKDGRALVSMEEGFNKMGRKVPTPNFT